MSGYICIYIYHYLLGYGYCILCLFVLGSDRNGGDDVDISHRLLPPFGKSRRWGRINKLERVNNDANDNPRFIIAGSYLPRNGIGAVAALFYYNRRETSSGSNNCLPTLEDSSLVTYHSQRQVAI